MNQTQESIPTIGAFPETEKQEDLQARQVLPRGPSQGPYYRVKIVHSCEVELCWHPTEPPFKAGEHVIVPSRYGKDLGRILGVVTDANEIQNRDIVQVSRRASEHDMATFRANIAKEQDALDVCKEKAALHNLDMKLVSAHYLLDEPKILFFFTADARVDFRELVKDLVGIFKMRIELRQIGVRDESRVIGGAAVCSRTYCCHGLTDKLRPVSIKMAKEQNLSLNSMKISGPCGRLLCCLSYEYDFYHEEKKKLPPEGSKIPFEDTLYRVSDVNILSKRIHLSSSDGRALDLPADRFRYMEAEGGWRIIPSS